MTAAALAAACALTASAAHADDAARMQAKEAYDRGLDAHKHGEMARAAREFAAADALAPSPASLQAALDAAIDADDVPLGAELLERSKRAPAPPGLASSITAATMKFNGRAGRLLIKCPASSTCAAKIDESPAPVDRVVWANVGTRTISVQVDSGMAQAKGVDITADDTVEITASKTGLGVRTGLAASVDAAATSQAPTREGLSPVIFYAAAGVTVVAAGITTYLMLHASSKHGDFTNAGCQSAASASCSALADSGKSAQSAANVGLLLTAAAALTTAVIGIGFVNWHRDDPHAVGLRPTADGFLYAF